MKKHVVDEHSEQLFACKSCGSRDLTQEELKRHRKSSHIQLIVGILIDIKRERRNEI
jgi:hypothetical protein